MKESQPDAPDQDRVYQSKRESVDDFIFDESVSSVFPDMVRRSIPGYETVTRLGGSLIARHLGRTNRIVDLGCSLGESTMGVLDAVGDTECEIIAVDRSTAMLSTARERVRDQRVQWVEADIRDLAWRDADAVLLNYTLQFLAPEDRDDLLTTIRANLVDTGVLLLSEKIQTDDFDEAAHLDFKRVNGYSELEISQKRTALENVMRIDTLATHEARLERAGFSRRRVWFQCLNWCSILAEP